MEIYLVGLGKMGYNLAQNMRDHGHEVIGFDVSKETTMKAEKEGFSTLASLTKLPDRKKVIWVMLPAGRITNSVLDSIKTNIEDGDIVIDGGNSNYKDSIRQAQEFSELGAYFLDIGTSGGVYGARNGASLMVGGNKEAYQLLEDFFDSIAEKDGVIYTGESGSGHYLKTVHNAILHTMMEVYGEGFELLHNSSFNYDLSRVTYAWNQSSVIRGWLLTLMQKSFEGNNDLSEYTSINSSSKDIALALDSAIENNVPMPAIVSALIMRQRSQQENTFSGKVVSALRKEVGGNVTK